MDSTQRHSFTKTHDDSPPLVPGPKRLHYQFSAALPQTHLTFVSVLQGVVFGLLLLSIPLPPENASWSTIFVFLLNQYLYLPYIISSLIIIIIWNQFVHASLFVTWPLSIFQSTLLFLLTMVEILTFGQLKVVSGQLKVASLSGWVFGLGWVGILGGIIRIHNIRWYHPRTPITGKGGSIRNVVKRAQDLRITKDILKNTEIRDGLYYIFGGIIWVGISLLYKPTAQSAPLLTWFMLMATIAILSFFIRLYTKLHRSHLLALAKDSDLDVLPNGLITYKRETFEMLSEELSKTTVHQQTDPHLPKTSPSQHLGTANKSSKPQWERLIHMLHLGFTGLTICAIGIWILRRFMRLR